MCVLVYIVSQFEFHSQATRRVSIFLFFVCLYILFLGFFYVACTATLLIFFKQSSKIIKCKLKTEIIYPSIFNFFCQIPCKFNKIYCNAFLVYVYFYSLFVHKPASEDVDKVEVESFVYIKVVLGDTESVVTSLDVVVGVVDVVLSVVLTAVLDVDRSVVWVVAIVLP